MGLVLISIHGVAHTDTMIQTANPHSYTVIIFPAITPASN